MLPYEPIRIQYGIPEYRLEDIELFGLPDHWGVLNYLVIDCKEISCPLSMEWKDEMHLLQDGVFIHRYDRCQRFKCTLYQLIGGSRVEIPSHVFRITKEYNPDPNKVWNSVREILKEYGYKKFYNRIPCILKGLAYPEKIVYNMEMIRKILLDFQKIHSYFDDIKKELKMDYFPNLRFVVLKLMERHGVVFQYYIPFIRVKKIQLKLDLIWMKLSSCL